MLYSAVIQGGASRWSPERLETLGGRKQYDFPLEPNERGFMSEFVKLETACGSKWTWCDIFDLEGNPYGAICCDECRSIIAKKEKGKQ